MNQQHKPVPVYVLAMVVAIGIALTGNIYAKDLQTDAATAITITGDGQISQTGRDVFGNSNPHITNDPKDGLQQLVTFAEPVTKTFVVRSSKTYNQVRDAAIEAGVTTTERVDSTEVFGIEDVLANCNLPMTAETYAKVRGLVIPTVDGALPTEAALLETVYHDLKSRIDSGELQLVTNGGTSDSEVA